MDSLNNPASSGHFLNTAGVLHSDQHANANDAIEALEAKVGVDGSAVTTTLDYLAKIALPKGVLGYAEVLTNQGSITTEVDLTSLSVAVTVGTGRRIRVTGHAYPTSTVTDDSVAVRIKEGATQLQIIDRPLIINRGDTFEGSVILSPTAGAHTYKLTMQRTSGTGTVTNNAAATTPSFILVEDIGKA